MCQPIEAIMDCQHIVTLDESHPHSRSNRGIHTSTWGADVHDGYIDVALLDRREICVNLRIVKKN